MQIDLTVAIFKNIMNLLLFQNIFEEEKMKTSADLRELLNRIDHRGYPAYKDTRGSWQFDGYVLSIDHVQGDPFAAPSAGLSDPAIFQRGTCLYFQG